MAHGGARNRSGPQPDPNSARSDRRGLSLTALPNEGYQGDIPDFPLGEGPDYVSHRERQVWVEAWRTPQAAAWAREPWRWPTIAEYCRLKATVEANPGAVAALVGHLHRYRDQIGLTPAGLKENGWAIAATDIQPADAADSEVSAPGGPSKPRSSRDRLSVVGA